MNFGEILQGATIFVLNKNTVEASQAKVASRGLPHFDPNSMGTSGMIVDVCLEINGKSATYCMPEKAETCYSGEFVFSTSRSVIASELETIYNQGKEQLAQMPNIQKRVELSGSILEEWNPEVKEKREQDKRLQNVEDKLSGLEKSINLLLSKLS